MPHPLPATLYSARSQRIILRACTIHALATQTLSPLVLKRKLISKYFEINYLYLQPVVTPPDSVTHLFHKHAGEDGKMDYKELRRFLQEATEKGM